ncbi:3-deoxy-D-manno-octulosonate 8-phosphate phosphatase [Taibaiella sp. KBW10]|uniref:KdsC family phosphatase n=1 Tax=Taibaiella sp. KBW10 TaxID=2153357 RepID=UPI000F59B1BE|nr:HAD hydrolase family protein [Taibaiella sp. KBW10]RQO31042.1 3-deoxy-D-manno-octulosonate 8-phosphate phosphatase [Taibaiella sp. KBW10]
MNILSLFEHIKVFVFDIDGVLTDSMLHVQETGELLRRMNIKDGYALQLAVKKGYHVWIISGGHSNASKRRLNNLGIQEVHIGVQDKLALLKEKMAALSITTEHVLYMGDDMPDIPSMQFCGLATCPNDAAVEVCNIAHYISPLKGGSGCVRDVIEKVLKINKHWE